MFTAKVTSTIPFLINNLLFPFYALSQTSIDGGQNYASVGGLNYCVSILNVSDINLQFSTDE